MPPRTPPKTQQARDPPPAPRRDATKRRVANPAALRHAARNLLAEFDSAEAVTQQELADPTQHLDPKPEVDLEPLPLPDLAPLPAATPPPLTSRSVMPPAAPKEATTQAGPKATPDDDEEDEAAV